MISINVRIIHRAALIFLIILMLTLPLVHAVETSTVHGTIYKINSYELVDNAIVQVNSTPFQSYTAKNGSYSFNLTPGNYSINASYYKNERLVAYKEETIKIKASGDYLVDIIIVPLSNSTDVADIISSIRNDPFIVTKDATTMGVAILTIIAILIFAGTIILFIIHRGKFINNNENTSSEENSNFPTRYVSEGEPLPSDLQEVMDILVAHGGRISQRDLRHKMKYSEAKVSLMVSELENRGLIEKFKKGRGNILIIKYQNNQNI